MATAAMAGAAGAAVVLYYTGWGNPWGVFGRRVAEDPYDEGTSEDREGGDTSSTERASRRRRLTMPRTTRPPSTWFEALSTLSETLRFTYSETLGKWPLGDLAFGINYLLRRQVWVHVIFLFLSPWCSGPHILYWFFPFFSLNIILTFPMSQVTEELEFLRLWTAFIWMQCLNKQNSIWHTHYISAQFYSLWDNTYLKACITHDSHPNTCALFQFWH